MAHIPDGILSAPVLIGGAAVALAGVTLGLRSLNDRAIPRTAILSAAFFTASLISVPVGPSSVHLLLSGLMGIMIGVAIFPAVGVALILQALLFGFGGLTTLGVNTVNIALPGFVLAMVIGPIIRSSHSSAIRAGLSALVGGLSVLGTGGLVALSLALSAPEYTPVASVLLATYLPLALAEAFITAAVVGFLSRVQPDALRLASGATAS
ncbi:cobalt transporter CbiM [uncultured Cohaesibacter sp.]|uniref:cobalt transporter CbiM n=1 Tax=uncultured Cohaesibacter sp. TaxID=1002546 RepID=UPI002AA74700|nr:cobalt transporter CbiM [uncultured Cohaesibacter sp.]